MKPKIIAIVGPTASGKTSLSIELAKKFNGEIISADSRQVYRNMNIGTGKVTKREMRGVPHYLLDVASPKKVFTVSQFQKQGRAAIKKILAKGKLPIIVGGTGLYVDALIYNRDFPHVKPNTALRKKLEAQSKEKLFAQLKKLDPRRAATIDAQNPRRLIRALEIILSTKQPVPSAKSAMNRESNYDTLILGISIPEKKLYQNIHKRLIARIRQGMIREVERLQKSGVSFKRLENFGLEYRYVGRYLQNKITKEEMIGQLQKEIEHYAKRQMTWFKRSPSITWIKNKKEAEKKVKRFIKFRNPPLPTLREAERYNRIPPKRLRKGGEVIRVFANRRGYPHFRLI